MNPYKELASATVLQAILDYFVSNENQKRTILKELNSKWMVWFSDGMSEIVAKKLITDPDGIQKRILEDTRRRS